MPSQSKAREKEKVSPEEIQEEMVASSEEIVVISLVDKEIKDSMEIGEGVVLEEDQVVIEVKGRTGATNGIREAQIMVDSVVTSLEEETEEGIEVLKEGEEGKETTVLMNPRSTVVATSRSVRPSQCRTMTLTTE